MRSAAPPLPLLPPPLWKWIAIIVPATVCILGRSTPVAALEVGCSPDRRRILAAVLANGGGGAASFLHSAGVSVAVAAEEPRKDDVQPHGGVPKNNGGLASHLAQRDPTALRNRLFNIPPPAQVYPDWMRGTWQLTCSFDGFLFPSTKLSRDRILADYEVPGFQKCSIATLADVGKDRVMYRWRVDPSTGWEDRSYNLAESIDAHLGYKAVNRNNDNAIQGIAGAVVPSITATNPNRLSIDFAAYRTINAERIELFVNARESEELSGDNPNSGVVVPTFVCSEYVRQLTFGTGSTAGVPRQVATNYGLFWTWRQTVDNPNRLQGNLLTAGYLDPQDPLYFEEPTLPVVLYSHVLQAQRIV